MKGRKATDHQVSYIEHAYERSRRLYERRKREREKRAKQEKESKKCSH